MEFNFWARLTYLGLGEEDDFLHNNTYLDNSMLEVQARIENGIMKIFWSSKNQETF